MSVHPLGDGAYQVRWREGGRTSPMHKRTFPKAKHARQDAIDFDAEIKRRKRLRGVVSIDQQLTLAAFFETYWRLHAVPNLANHTRAAYKQTWAKHLLPRIGDRQVTEITPGIVARLRADLERAGVGVPAVRKAMAVLQSVLSFAIVEGLTEFNAAASVKKPRYVRARQPRVFSPVDVEHLRCLVATPLDRALISVLAYSGARPEEALRLTWPDVGSEALHYHDSKRGHRERWTPLLDHLRRDLRDWHLVCGRPDKGPVFPAHDGDHWQLDDWRNWRTRVWREVAPAGSRPRDLRGSFITLRVYEGIPLTTVATEAGTSVAMIDKHYAGVIANWDGKHIPADKQIERARAKVAEDRTLRRKADW